MDKYVLIISNGQVASILKYLKTDKNYYICQDRNKNEVIVNKLFYNTLIIDSHVVGQIFSTIQFFEVDKLNNQFN